MGLGNGLAWQTRKVPKAATFFRFAIDIRAEISQGCKRYATEKSEPREGKMPQSTRLYTAGVAGAAQARRVALNVQGSSQQGVQSLPAKQAITGTRKRRFTDPALANANPLVLALPPGGPCEQEAFDITFSGYVTTTQSSTVVFKLYLGASATIGSNTVLASTTSATVATTTVPFRFTRDSELRFRKRQAHGHLQRDHRRYIDGPDCANRRTCKCKREQRWHEPWHPGTDFHSDCDLRHWCHGEHREPERLRNQSLNGFPSKERAGTWKSLSSISSVPARL
jgi:hypothetical protein